MRYRRAAVVEEGERCAMGSSSTWSRLLPSHRFFVVC